MTTDQFVGAGRQLPPVLAGFDLTDQAGFAAGFPHYVFARLRRDAPVLWHPPGQSADGEGFWVLSRHDDIMRAAADPLLSSQGGGGRMGGGTHLDDLAMGVHAGALLPMMDDPRHELISQLVGPAVGRRVVTALEDEFRRCAAAVVDAAVARGRCDFANDVSGPFAIQTMALVLGIPRQDWAQLGGWLDAVVGIVGRRSGKTDEAVRTTNLAIYGYCKHLLGAKRADPADDLTSVIACGEIRNDRGEPPLTAYEREVNFLLFLQTGSEQPRNTLAGGIVALAERPDLWRQLRADRSLLPGAVEEMLRWAPPNPYNRRTATRQMRFGDVHIQTGDKVTLWWASANRDETVFPEPATFDIWRMPNPHMAFGYGSHSCLGDRLARLQIRLLLDALLDRVKEIRVTGPVRWSPSNKHAVMVDLPVELLPTSHSRPDRT